MNRSRENGLGSPPQSISAPWDRYYKEYEPTPFGENKDLYLNILRGMAQNYPSILDPQLPKRFVLGGFHPYNGTPDDFKRFCEELHPNPNDILVYLDMNRFPLTAAKVDGRAPTYRVQASLECLPFQDNKVDFIILDFTVDYMDPQKLADFSRSAAFSLSRNGLVLVTKTFPQGLEHLKQRYPRLPQLTLHPRYVGDLIDTMSSLKLVEASIGYKSSITIFARKDSSFKTYEPSTSVLQEDYPWPK